MSKAPRCKLCGHEHWNSEPHRYEKAAAVTETTRDWPIIVTRVDVGFIEVDQQGNIVRGRPRKHADNAARQRAYRAKKKAASS